MIIERVVALAATFYESLRKFKRYISQKLVFPRAENANTLALKRLATKDHTHEEYVRRGETVQRAYKIEGRNDFSLADHTHPQYVSETDLSEGKFYIDNAQLLRDVNAYMLARKFHTHPYALKYEIYDRTFHYKAQFMDGKDVTSYFAKLHHTHEEYVPRTEPVQRTLALFGRPLTPTETYHAYTAEDFARARHEHPEYATNEYRVKDYEVTIGVLRGLKLSIYRSSTSSKNTTVNMTFSLPRADELRYLPEGLVPRRLIVTLPTTWQYLARDAMSQFLTNAQPSYFVYQTEDSELDITRQILSFFGIKESETDVYLRLTLFKQHFSYFVQEMDVDATKPRFVMIAPFTAYTSATSWINHFTTLVEKINSVNAWVKAYAGLDPSQPQRFDAASMLGSGAVWGGNKVTAIFGGVPFNLFVWEERG